MILKIEFIYHGYVSYFCLMWCYTTLWLCSTFAAINTYVTKELLSWWYSGVRLRVLGRCLTGKHTGPFFFVRRFL